MKQKAEHHLEYMGFGYFVTLMLIANGWKLWTPAFSSAVHQSASHIHIH